MYRLLPLKNASNIMDATYNRIISLIEENKLEEAIDTLLAFAQLFDAEKETAVRLHRSTLNDMAQEEMLFGRTNSWRDNRNRLKLQLIQLARAIRENSMKKKERITPILNSSQLLDLYREGDVEALLERLSTDLAVDSSAYHEFLLIEQDWKHYKYAQQNNLATSEVLLVQRSQINERILKLLLSLAQ
jgi:hypothetical protein